MWPNPQFSADWVTFTEERFNRKFHFLCTVKIPVQLWWFSFLMMNLENVLFRFSYTGPLIFLNVISIWYELFLIFIFPYFVRIGEWFYRFQKTRENLYPLNSNYFVKIHVNAIKNHFRGSDNCNREVYDRLKISKNALNRNLRENTDNSTN